MSKQISEAVFSSQLPSLEDLEMRYPERSDLADGASVTRVAPSPTGFMHIGTLYTGLLCERLAAQSEGVSFLRIEDTDQKRKIEGAEKFTVDTFHDYGIAFGEGMQADGSVVGRYGPYKQSERAETYSTIVKHMIEAGSAYVCFCTTEELAVVRAEQESKKVDTGYYGQWATCRDHFEDEVVKRLEAGTPHVIRLRSTGDTEKIIHFRDKISGQIDMPQNVHDIVIRKQDGLPTYHLAHVVDDHFMRTTLVLRGDEWLSSVPIHLQLWDTLGWRVPKYAHIRAIYTMDGESRRKLSKRKDPEANMQHFEAEGFPREAVLEYLTNLANSKFDSWRQGKPDAPRTDYQITMKGLQQSSGPLFDFVKLKDIGKEIVAKLTAPQLYEKLMEWSKDYDQEFHALINANADYATAALNIERGTGKKQRKDGATYKDVRHDISFFFDEEFSLNEEQFIELMGDLTPDLAAQLMDDYMKTFDFSDDKDSWFAKLKDVAAAHNFALNTRDFKDNPEQYAGSVSDVAKVVRVLITGRVNTPDLHTIIQVMGQDRVQRRLNIFSQSS